MISSNNHNIIENKSPPVFTTNNNNNNINNNNCNNVQFQQQLAAASFGGAVSAIVTCPFDVVKTRIQIAPSSLTHQVFSGTTDAFVKIVKNEGVLTLWRGLAPSLLMTVPNAAIYFNSYEALKRYITKNEILGGYQALVPLVSGALARVVAVATLSPLELIRTNFQAQQKERTVLSFVKKIGIKRMWLGVGATLSRDVPFSAIYWSCYEFIKREIKPHITQTTSGAFLTSFISGASSGMLAAILTTPIDLIKTRIQTTSLSPSLSSTSSAAVSPSLSSLSSYICHGKYIIGSANIAYCISPSSSSSCCSPTNNTNHNNNNKSSLSSSSTSKSSSLSSPSSLSSSNPATAKEIAKMIYREEGLNGFMRGWLPRAVKVGPACAIMISSYELIKSIGTDCNSG